MRVKRSVLFFTVFISLWLPSVSYADTTVVDDIETDTTWTKEGSPYIVENWITITSDAKLSLEHGVIVKFDSSAGLDIVGSIEAKGTTEDPVTLTSTGDGWSGIVFENQNASSSLDHILIEDAYSLTALYSKELSLSNTTVQRGKFGLAAIGSHLVLDTFSAKDISFEALNINNGSDATLKNITLENVSTGVLIYDHTRVDITNLFIENVFSSALLTYAGSSVQVASSTIKNIVQSSGAVEVFNESSLDMEGLTIDDVSQGDGLSVFNNSSMILTDASVSNVDGYAVTAFNSGSLTGKNLAITNGTRSGITVFSGGSVALQDSHIYGFLSGEGVSDYGSWDIDHPNSLSLTNNEIKNNQTGIGLYSNNSLYVISQNSIHDNISYGLVSYGTQSTDVRNNFWGDASGPYNDPANLGGKGNTLFSVSDVVSFSPWLPLWGVTQSSNVLFLPGIEGSRLYEGTGCGKASEEKLWEPYDGFSLETLRGAGDNKLKELFLNQSGKSVCTDIYTKEDDVIDSVKGSNFYKSFIDQMNGLKKDGTLKDWKAVSYDWRLSLSDLLTNGVQKNGNVYYEKATSTPYIEQTLRSLAMSSKTGKVTIVAHSNGGLLAKALLNKLGDTEATKLVDKVIMIAVPQSGAPSDIGAMLVGYDAGLYGLWGFISIISNATARAFTQNAPMAYHLLPSEDYLESTAGDSTHPVIHFAGSGYLKEEVAYGNTIANRVALDDFLIAKEGGRNKPESKDLLSAEILNPALIAYANIQHAILDHWTPPKDIEVDQIAGWGVDTVAGVDFYTSPPINMLTALNPQRLYRPIFTEDGDGTVTIPSALMMASSTNVKRYWLDLGEYFKVTKIKRTHADIFEIPSMQNLIGNIIQNKLNALPVYISSNQPPPSKLLKKLTFFLHSPLTLELKDSLGNTTGLGVDDSVTQNIPGSTYGEFGEVKYVTVPEDSAYALTLHGQSSGTFSLDAQESSGGTVATSSTITGVPATASTTVSMIVSPDATTLSPMTVDSGDGNITIITPRLGETVVFNTAPVELQITFATSTNALTFTGVGSGVTTTSTTYPILGKNQTKYRGIATTTVTAIDSLGNTTAFIYTKKLPEPLQRSTITPVALAYNGATTTFTGTSFTYKWRTNSDGLYMLFASYIQTASSTIESHYRPVKNKTVLMSKTKELDDSDDDSPVDIRPTKQIVPGMVIPYIKTKKGSLIVGY